MTVYDIPVLLGLGFTYGITSDTLWGIDKDGKEVQVQMEDGEFLTFHERNPDNPRIFLSGRRMGREEFGKRFT